MSGKETAEELDTPFFQCFRQDSMICVCKGFVYDPPSILSNNNILPSLLQEVK